MGVIHYQSATPAALAAVLACLVTGCDIVQTPTLATVGKQVFDDTLVGEWVSTAFDPEPFANGREPQRMRISREGDRYLAEFRGVGQEITERRFRLYRVGELLLAEVTIDSERGQWLTLAAVARDGDALGMRLLSGEWIDNHLVANRGTFGCFVRSSAEDLVEALTAAGLEAFSGPTVGYTKDTPLAAE